MNENERTPAETAADYAVHFADGFFVPCPCCGKEVKSPDNGFTSEKEAMEWALGACDCEGAKAWQQQRPALRMDSPCAAGKMKAGRCGHTAYTARCTGSACSAYRPELYAPELYARAFDLYAKRKAEEKEWAEFHPAATIMRYCRQLPAPAPLLGAADLQNRKLLLLRPASRFTLRGTDAGRSGPVRNRQMRLRNRQSLPPPAGRTGNHCGAVR